MAIKPYHQFVSENLSGEYCYYGPGSLYPLVAKLASEGKGPEFIYTYLTHLGVDDARKRNVISQVFSGVEVEEALVMEDDIDDLISAEVEDDITKDKKKKKKKGEGDDDEEDGEDEDGEDDDDEDEDGEDSEEAKVLKRALEDQGKIDRIRKILKEARVIDLPANTPLEFAREVEQLLRESLEMGGGARPLKMFYWNRNDTVNGGFECVGAGRTEDLFHFVKLLGIKEYYVYKSGFKDLTESGGGPEHLEVWRGPDDSYVSAWPDAMAKRTINP